MRLWVYGLLALAVLLQYPLWFSSGGIPAIWQLHREIDAQRAENQKLTERNRALAADVIDLKEGLEAIEERARAELGMIKKGETFFQVVEQPAAAGESPRR